MSTFVLIAGATLGGWCWKRVTPLLRSLDHDVYPVTLTGLAERAHLFNPEVGLETHIQDITRFIEVEELTDVILVGHSLGVDPVTAAADRIWQRIAQLVYFDSLPSKNGTSGFDTDNLEWQAWVRGQVIETDRGPLFQPPDSRNFGLSDDADIRWVNAKMTAHPFKAWTDPLHLRNEQALAQLPKSYIACIGANLPDQAREPGTEGMRYYELPLGHLAMVNAPDEVARLFDTIARQA